MPGKAYERPTWQVLICCNSQQNGEFRGWADEIEIGCGYEGLNFGTDLPPVHQIVLVGPKLTIKGIDRETLRIGRIRIKRRDMKRHFGGRLMDGYIVDKPAVRKLLKYLARMDWDPEHGSTRLWRYFLRLQEHFSNKE